MIDPTAFRDRGYLVLRGFFEAGPLAAEVDRALRDGARRPFSAAVGEGRIEARFVPMMTAETPRSLELLDRLEPVAAALLGGPVIPTRAKGVRYAGSTPWHADSERPVPSVGLAAYLEPLDATSGALQVRPGSHRGAADPAEAVPTDPGDVIVFDEHLQHASAGEGVRRQWRVDFVRAPATAAAEAELQAYFADIFPIGWDGGYDPARYPSYGPAWQASARPAAARLRELGVYALAAAHEVAFRPA